ncbi:MAG: hypothetical protein GY765_39425 [bacterium]|nr:hypothetical protein [bacterium]
MKRKSLSAAYFSLGAFALISQTMILREFFVVVHGNEFSFGILLTNWLIGIMCGALLGGAIADRTKRNLEIFTISLLLMSVLFPAAITAVRFLYTISGTAAGTYISFSNVFIYSALFIIPVSFFVGFSFPIAARVHTAGYDEEKRVSGISSIYIFEAAGSLFSGIVYTFFLVGRFSPFFIAFLAVLPLPLCGWLVTRRKTGGILRIISFLMALLCLAALTPTVYKGIETATTEARWRSFSKLPLTFSMDSRYQNIAVARLGDQYNLYLNTMFAGVFPENQDNMLQAALLMAQSPVTAHPKQILVIGNAVGGPARFLLRYKVGKIISIEIDAAVVDTILRFLPGEDKRLLRMDERFQVIIEDGRQYVKALATTGTPEKKDMPPGGFDIVYVNIPEPSTLLLNRYYTVEFFRDVAKILRPGGVMALQITGTQNYADGLVGAYTACIYNTVKTVFPGITATPGSRCLIFASADKKSISKNPATLAERYSRTGVSPKSLGMIFESFYPPAETEAVRKALSGYKGARLNTDESPIAAFYFSKIIGWYGQKQVAGMLEFFGHLNLRDIMFLLVGLFLSRLLFIAARRAPRHREAALKFHTLVAVFSSGMAALALELVLLYLFQVGYGDVYRIIGFIIAVFMFGLPLGAYVSGRRLAGANGRSDTWCITFMMAIQIGIACIALLLPWVTGIFGRGNVWGQLLIFAITILIGFATGLMFPLSIHLYLRKDGKTGKTAGLIDAVDHMGAAVGAFFIGSLLLPVIGIAKVCGLLAIVPSLSLLLLLTDNIRLRSKT